MNYSPPHYIIHRQQLLAKTRYLVRSRWGCCGWEGRAGHPSIRSTCCLIPDSSSPWHGVLAGWPKLLPKVVQSVYGCEWMIEWIQYSRKLQPQTLLPLLWWEIRRCKALILLGKIDKMWWLQIQQLEADPDSMRKNVHRVSYFQNDFLSLRQLRIALPLENVRSNISVRRKGHRDGCELLPVSSTCYQAVLQVHCPRVMCACLY